MTAEKTVLELLAQTGASSTGQLAQITGLERRAMLTCLEKLEAGELVSRAAKVRLATSGRPQMVWSLRGKGARRAGIYFPPSVQRDALIKGLLKTHFVLTHPEVQYPLFFTEQVIAFERQGEPWPWQGKEGPLRVGALIGTLGEQIQVALALAKAREAQQYVPPSLPLAKNPRYRLTLLVTQNMAEFIESLLHPTTDWNDPFFQQQKTYREWKGVLHGLTPTEADRYRHHIERVLKWIEMDEAENSGERYDLVLRAFSELEAQPDVMTMELGPIQWLIPKERLTPGTPRSGE